MAMAAVTGEMMAKGRSVNVPQSAVEVVSVVIPVYNTERYLGEAIDSVLKQGHKPLEVVVVNDGSTDNTMDVISRYGSRIRCISQDNQGTAAARNSGVRAARGEYLAFLDADDIWLDGKLECQVAVLRADPDIEAVYGHARQFFSPDLDPALRDRIPLDNAVVAARLPAAMLIRRAAFDRVGWFETSCQVGHDMSWPLRADDLGLRSVMLDNVVFLRRVHGRNKGLTKRYFASHRMRIIKEAFDRRRRTVNGGEIESEPGEGA